MIIGQENLTECAGKPGVPRKALKGVFQNAVIHSGGFSGISLAQQSGFAWLLPQIFLYLYQIALMSL